MRARAGGRRGVVFATRRGRKPSGPSDGDGSAPSKTPRSDADVGYASPTSAKRPRHCSDLRLVLENSRRSPSGVAPTASDLVVSDTGAEKIDW